MDGLRWVRHINLALSFSKVSLRSFEDSLLGQSLKATHLLGDICQCSGMIQVKAVKTPQKIYNRVLNTYLTV